MPGYLSICELDRILSITWILRMCHFTDEERSPSNISSSKPVVLLSLEVLEQKCPGLLDKVLSRIKLGRFHCSFFHTHMTNS